MSTPEELLCSRRWRVVQSLWMVLGWVPLALTAWLGYLIIGLRARNWKWLLISAGLLAWLVAWIAWAGTFPATAKGDPVPPEYASSMGWWTALSFIVWLGNAIGLQWRINRKWLVAHAHRAKTGPWYATATAGTISNSGDAAGVARTFDLALGSPGTSPDTGPSYHPATPSPTASEAQSSPMPYVAPRLAVPAGLPPLDVNHAGREQLAALPGLDFETADRIIAARQRLGGFRDATELVTFGGLKPHLFAAVQGRLTVLSPGPEGSARRPEAAPTPAGPDSTRSGRRLDF